MATVLYVKIATWVGVELFCTIKTTSRPKYSTEYLLCAVWEGNAAPTLVALVYPTIETFRPETPADSYNYRSIGKVTPTDLSMFLQNKD